MEGRAKYTDPQVEEAFLTWKSWMDKGWMDDGSAACVFQNDGDNTWSTGERIYLFEGSIDLCDGSNGYCEIDVTIVKLGVGNEDDRVLGYVSTYADGTN